MSDATSPASAQPHSAPSVVARTELLLPSIVGWERVAMQAASATARLAGLPVDRVEDVQTAVCEATLNAMEHGNGFDAHRLVRVLFVTRTDGLEVQVEDERHAFFHIPPPSAQAPKLVDRLAGSQDARGWGLFLICSLMDEVEVVNAGRGAVLRMFARRL